ncbi:hypothetical protein CU097_003984, partial [Rhizopus azygosporus]
MYQPLKSWVKAVKEASKKEKPLEVDDVIEEQSKKNQHLYKLKEEHIKILEEFIDNGPVATLDEMASINFMQNCIFIGGSGFNFYTARSQDGPKKE